MNKTAACTIAGNLEQQAVMILVHIATVD